MMGYAGSYGPTERAGFITAWGTLFFILLKKVSQVTQYLVTTIIPNVIYASSRIQINLSQRTSGHWTPKYFLI